MLKRENNKVKLSAFIVLLFAAIVVSSFNLFAEKNDEFSKKAAEAVKFFSVAQDAPTAAADTTLTPATNEDDPNSIFDLVLKNYVTDEGLVNYSDLRSDEDLEDFLSYLRNTDPDTLPSREHSLAFWINAYNAFVLKGVINNYPVKNVLKVGLIPHTFFRVTKYETKHGNLTLSKIENSKIRDGFREPRIHFAINCASHGCPILLNKAYRAETLEEQLEVQAEQFINDKSKNRLDRKSNKLYLSRIFKWYEGDFLKDGKTLVDYVLKYLNDSDAQYIKENKIDIEFAEYDWNVNEIKNVKWWWGGDPVVFPKYIM